MNSTTIPRELFDDDSAAAYIGDITARTIRNWRTQRGLPFIRITNKVIRIRRSDLALATQMTPEQITDGVRLTREFNPSRPESGTSAPSP